MLFNETPERFVHSADVTCLHFHGTAIAKPIPSQQAYHGPLFEIVDKAVDFVMDRVRRTVVPSGEKVASDVTYEVPLPVVREALVNAVAHRNYASKSGVQVMVFSDRIEVWNPGALPEDLTIDQLREPHPSVPRNRLICEPLYLAHYIERAGTGTLDMIRLCRAAGLPEPEFHSEGERFRTVICRDWLTDAVMGELGLNDRQKKAVTYVKTNGAITNSEFQRLVGVTRKTATRDRTGLVACQAFDLVGSRLGAHYVIAKGRK